MIMKNKQTKPKKRKKKSNKVLSVRVLVREFIHEIVCY